MPEVDPKIEEYQQRFKTVVEARNFHYQSFLNWSTYFSVIVGALFVALYTILGSDSITAMEKFGYSTLIAFIGYIVSLAWHWSNKGYNYWWNHWSMFLTDIESDKDIDKKVYSMFYDAGSNFLRIVKPANYSTSKIATFISFCISVAWGYLFLQMGYCFLHVDSECFICGKIDVCCIVWMFVVSLFFTCLAMPIISMFFLQTNLDNHYVQEDGEISNPQDRKCLVNFCGNFCSGKYIYRLIRCHSFICNNSWILFSKGDKKLDKKVKDSFYAEIIKKMPDLKINDKGELNKELMTNEVKTALTKLGESKFYRVYTNKVDKDHLKEIDNYKFVNKEWLFDLIWYKDPQDKKGEFVECKKGDTYFIKSLDLAVESEWGGKRNGVDDIYGEVKYDFQKLVVVNAKHRVMIFQDQNDDLKQITKDIKRQMSMFPMPKGSSILCIAYGVKWNGFKYRVFTK